MANGALLKALKPNAKVAVEFVERQPGEWVITSVNPLIQSKAAKAAASDAHSGH